MILMCNGYQQLFAYCDSSHNIVLIAKKTADSQWHNDR